MRRRAAARRRWAQRLDERAQIAQAVRREDRRGRLLGRRPEDVRGRCVDRPRAAVGQRDEQLDEAPRAPEAGGLEAAPTEGVHRFRDPHLRGQDGAQLLQSVALSTGTGKTYLGCALAHSACREDFSALYVRLPRLLADLDLARMDGRFGKLLAKLARTDLLVLDDFGLAPLGDRERHDLLEILEDRHGRRSTIVTSQLPWASWHASVGDPTLADAILDRLVHNAYKIELAGESLRKRQALTEHDQEGA